MPTSPSFVEHVRELLAGVGPVETRAMFGGYGVRLNGISIGLIDDDRLYLRTDEQSKPQFEAAGAQPFTYQSKNGPRQMGNYWSLPDEAVDDPDVAVKWGRLAAEASVRAEAAKKKPGSAKKKAPAAKATNKPIAKKAVAKKPIAKKAPKRKSAAKAQKKTKR